MGRQGKNPLGNSKVRRVTSSRNPASRGLGPAQQVLGPKKISKYAAEEKEQKRARWKNITNDEKQKLEAQRKKAHEDVQYSQDDEDAGWVDDFADVLHGNQRLDISHAGGEFKELARQLLGDISRM
ncbi:hypothetical protein HYDPIDRAFT_33820 [Hydnomerulius pinastri MD-312]|uniref:Uncharacterized protein n=1 Tax=Hydnomerulius pinastri MD-312 TaxID=994086 RepID=A0A0C9W868_9AGAM|nr:hypothetical protein HYDPIDRAFT_33820 [Hydnomerulius pinastri MD-312]